MIEELQEEYLSDLHPEEIPDEEISGDELSAKEETPSSDKEEAKISGESEKEEPMESFEQKYF